MGMNSRSSGISKKTGPGTPVVAMRNALCTYSGRRAASGTLTDHLVIDRIRDTWSMSWSEPLSAKPLGPAPPMSTSGTCAR